MKIALVGNPNSGKTTLFNLLTHQNQKVGNWSGVTVEYKIGKYCGKLKQDKPREYSLQKSYESCNYCKRNNTIEIVDLPGVYSLNAITKDEKVTVNYLKDNKLDLIIQIIDSTVLERSLALTLQLLEQNIPIVLALNMQEELNRSGTVIDYKKMEQELGVSCVPIAARSGKGVHVLMEHVVKGILNDKEYKQPQFTAMGESPEQQAEYRHKYIAEKVRLFKTTAELKEHNFTEKIDKIILNKWLAFPVFAVVIWLMYFVSVQTVGHLFIGWLDRLFFDIIGENLRTWLINIGAASWVTSLTVDGIVAGVGSVLTFIPQILMLFIFISFLEGCGYMARVAIIMDRLFKKLGLSGKSFIPMIVGCGCSVPAIMSAKTVDGDQERGNTIILTPFIPCSAKLPIFALIAGALFPHNSFVAPSMYFLGILMVILGGLLLKLFNRRKRSTDMLLIELPHYRLPAVRNVSKEIWDKAKGFIIRAGVVIVPATIILWFLQSFNFSMQQANIENSMLAQIGKVISYIFIPLGFGNWESTIAFLSGTVAKETVVATFGVILGGDLSTQLPLLFTPQSAYAFMAFVLLFVPCVAAIAATRKEIGRKGMWLAIAFQSGVAYLTALIINQAGNLFAYYPTTAISIIAILVIALIFGLVTWHLIKNRKKVGGCSMNCGGCVKSKECGRAEQ